MAASISSSPGSILAPICERLWYTLTGYIPASQYKYRYVIDIYVDGTQVARVLRSPDPGSNDAKFNLRPLIEEYLIGDPEGDTSFPLFSTPAVTGDLFDKPAIQSECVKVEVKIGESLASTATGEPVLTANQDTETLYVWNGEIRRESGRPIADFYLANDNRYLLSDREPDTYRWPEAPAAIDSSSIVVPIWEDSYYVLSFLNDNGTYASGQAATKVEYVIATPTESASQYATINATSGAATPGGTVDANQKVIRLAAGPANLDAVTDPVLTDLPGSVNWTYYKLRLVDNSNVAMSRWYVFVKRTGCTKENRYALFWKSEAGGWDGFDGFDGVTFHEDQYQRKFYRQQPITSLEQWEATLKPAQVITDQVYKLTSRFLQAGEHRLLRSCFRSKEVYLHSLDGGEEFLPVVIKATSFTPQPKGLFNVTVDCTLA